MILLTTVIIYKMISLFAIMNESKATCMGECHLSPYGYRARDEDC